MSRQWGTQARRADRGRGDGGNTSKVIWRAYRRIRAGMWLLGAGAVLSAWSGQLTAALVLGALAVWCGLARPVVGRALRWSHDHSMMFGMSGKSVPGIGDAQRHDLARTLEKYR